MEDPRTRGVGGKSPANIQKHLEGVNYPASKEDPLNKARSNNAPNEAIREIESLQSDRFGGPQDVMKAYGKNE